MKDLLVEGEKKWNQLLIRQKFSDDLANRIISIPTLAEGSIDRLGWGPVGVTVKSFRVLQAFDA